MNALAIYNYLIQVGGFSDDNIVLMVADEIPANPRNPHKNKMYWSSSDVVWSNTTRLDYRGDDVTVDALRRVLMGKGSRKRVLKTDKESNIFVYWTGHGGDQFFKFQDVQEITATDIATLFQEMEYKEILFLADTCQAFTLGDAIRAPDITVIGSSLRGENSYAHHADPDLGLSVIERYTHLLMQILRNKRDVSQYSLQEILVDPFEYKQQRAHVGVKQGARSLHEIPMSDFFVNVASKTKHRPKLLAEPASASASQDIMWSALQAYS
jgi:phosphatidylinositol glycan class K